MTFRLALAFVAIWCVGCGGSRDRTPAAEPGRPFGSACSGNADCASSLCLTSGTAFCTQECVDDCDCPMGNQCVMASDSLRVCTPGLSTCMAAPDSGSTEMDAGPVGPGVTSIPFGPSNLGCSVQDRPLEELRDIRITDDRACTECTCFGTATIDTDEGVITCASRFGGEGRYRVSFELYRQPAGEGPATELAVFYVRSLEVASDSNLRIRGDRPVVIVAQDRITVAGRFPGTGGYLAPDSDFPEFGNGPGGGTYSPRTTSFGGGAEGASFCTRGALGAEMTTGRGRVYGTPELVPITGGSSGGKPRNANRSGDGGGVVHLIAGTSIVIAAGGNIDVTGERGETGGSEGSGGGSGGAILLEAPVVHVMGTLRADGGGGGTFVGGAGATGSQPAQPGTTNPGLHETYGGGGGGLGRIRINTSSGAEISTGARISPPPETGCMTEGTVSPRSPECPPDGA